MKIIKSTNNKDILVDDEHFDRLNEFRWSAVKTYNTAYARTRMPYSITMHQFLMGSFGKIYVDHIDGNGLNNQINNLRLCNNQLNQANSRKHKHCKSKYKGVSFSKAKKKWRAYICPNKKFIHLGYFNNEKIAALAYNKAARKIWKEFAFINEII